ncbi:MAG: hypothetical protein EBV82_10135, partial [Chitinophagia bacterium]|nr:hypothetical protein [Chitinophagia bacterium]
NTKIDNNLLVSQRTRLNDSLTVMGVTRLNDSLTVNGRTRINDSLLVRGNVKIDSNLFIGGKLTVASGLDFKDSLTVSRGARIDSSLLLKGKLLLTDSLLAKGAVKVDGNILVKGYNVSDSIQRFSDSIAKFSTTKLNAADTASLSNRIGTLSSGSNKFTADLKVNYGGGSFGKYTNGQTIPAAGKTIDEVFYDILTTVIHPSYTPPSASLSMGYSGNLEIGTNLGTLTFAPTFTQNLGGAFSKIDYKKGGSIVATNSGSPSVTDVAGTLTTSISYMVTYTYAAGTTVLKNNIGQDDVTNQVQAGTVNSNTVTITPASYKYWGMSTNSSANITDADILAMVGGSKEWATSKLKSSFTITGPGGSGPVKYAYYAVPHATAGTITSIMAGGFESIAAFDVITR